MSRKRKLTLLLGTAFLSSGFVLSHAYAQDADAVLWSQLDGNADGWLSGRELSKDLLRYDDDNDGEVTKAEFLEGRRRDKLPLPPNPVIMDSDLAPPPGPFSPGPAAPAPFAPPAPGVVTPEPATPVAYPAEPAAPQPPLSSALQRLLGDQRAQPNAGKVGAANSTNTQPILGKLVGGRPVGFFYMQKYWFATRSLEKSCWYFTEDGRAYQDLATGFSEKELAEHKGTKATFAVQGTKLTFTWPDGKTSSGEMEIEGDGFIWDTGNFIPVEPFGNKSIVGDYEGGMSSTFSGTSAAVAKTLRLRADGTFELEGIASFRTEEDSSRRIKSEQLASGSGALTGTWKQDGFFLTLTSRSGETQRHIIFPFDSAETPIYPDRLFMSNIMYKKF